MSMQMLVNSFEEEGYVIEDRGRTHYGEWAILLKEHEGWFSNYYRGVIFYLVKGDVSESHMKDFSEIYSELWVKHEFDSDDESQFVYTGKCDSVFLRKYIEENVGDTPSEVLSIKLVEGDVISSSPLSTTDTHTLDRTKVFVVHGHDREMRESIARTLEHLDLEPIILEEQPSMGKTIIEKIDHYSDVSFATVLLSPDDIAYSHASSQDISKTRARQNVILELGCFLGKLGRNRVVAIYNENRDFEPPSDFGGVVYIPYDRRGRWKFELVKELRACGIDVDANKIV